MVLFPIRPVDLEEEANDNLASINGSLIGGFLRFLHSVKQINVQINFFASHIEMLQLIYVATFNPRDVFD